MNAVLVEIYSTIIPSAPYVIAAFALLWAVMVVWLFIQFRKQDKLGKQLMLIEEELEERKASPANR